MTIYAVVYHDYQDTNEPVRVVASFRSRQQADDYINEHWGYGYIVVAVPISES